MKSIWLSACLTGFVALFIVNSATAQRPDDRGSATIRLEAATFSPGRGERPDVPPGLVRNGYPAGIGGYYIVQFDGAVGDAASGVLSGAGADILGYIPDNAYKVRMTSATARAVERLDGVGWVGVFHPAYKLSARLTRDGTRLYRLRVETGADFDAAADAVLDAGAEIVREGGNSILVLADSGILDEMARVLDVAWIEDFQFHERFNEYAAGGIMGAKPQMTPATTALSRSSRSPIPGMATARGAVIRTLPPAASQFWILGIHFALVSPTFGFRGCDDRRLGPCRGPARAAPPAGAVGRKAGHEPANGGD